MLHLWDTHEPLHQFKLTGDTWTLPKCLRHDQGTQAELHLSTSSEIASILLQQDLGDLTDIFSYIKSLSEKPQPQDTAHISALGNTLGRSLANLHDPATLCAVLAETKLERTLTQNLTNEVIWSATMEQLPSYLQDFPNGDALFQRVAEDMRNPKYTYPACLAHGDFHTGNVAVSISNIQERDQQPKVIDWEFATANGRGVNGDAAQFLASLHCEIIASRQKDGTPELANLLRYFCSGFCAGYQHRARLECTMELNDVNFRLYRSALLLHGRDMINYARDFCEGHEADEEMVRVGVWYLERAGKDMDEFLGWSNMLELEREDEMLIRSLFFFA